MRHFPASVRGQKFWLAIECGLLFVGVPVAYLGGWLPVTIIPLLLVMTGGCWLVLRWQHKTTLHQVLRTKAPGWEWRRILIVHAAAIPCLVCLLWLTKPAALFSLVRHQPMIWLLVMFAYPLVSVFRRNWSIAFSSLNATARCLAADSE